MALNSALRRYLETLDRWIHQAEIDEGRAAGLTSEEREKLRHLSRENKLFNEEKRYTRKPVGSFTLRKQVLEKSMA